VTGPKDQICKTVQSFEKRRLSTSGWAEDGKYLLGSDIKIDIPNCKLEVELSDEEISDRLAKLPDFEPKVKTGYLRRYAEKVSSASTGAVFR
jgi:hypothetical protein